MSFAPITSKTLFGVVPLDDTWEDFMFWGNLGTRDMSLFFYWERAELIKRRWERRFHYKYVFSQNILGKNACGNWGRRSWVPKNSLGLPRPCTVFVSHQKLTETSVKTVRCLMAKAPSQHGSRRAAQSSLKGNICSGKVCLPQTLKQLPEWKHLLH